MNRPCLKSVASSPIAGSADAKVPLTHVAFNTMRRSTSQLKTFTDPTVSGSDEHGPINDFISPSERRLSACHLIDNEPPSIPPVMSRLVQCRCRSHCLTFNPETQSYEGEGALVPKSTAANHQQDDVRSRTLDAFTEDVATQVLRYSPPAVLHCQHALHPESDNRRLPPGSHDQPRLNDLYFTLEAETAYRCTWAPINHSLAFAAPPPPTLQYRHPLTSELHTPNREPYALDPRNIANAAYLENESRLCAIFGVLGQRPVCDVRDHLLTRVYEGLAMMERHKEAEWNRQRAGSLARLHGHSVVETGMYGVSAFLEPHSTNFQIRSLLQELAPGKSSYLHFLPDHSHPPPIFSDTQACNFSYDRWHPKRLESGKSATRNCRPTPKGPSYNRQQNGFRPPHNIVSPMSRLLCPVPLSWDGIPYPPPEHNRTLYAPPSSRERPLRGPVVERTPNWWYDPQSSLSKIRPSEPQRMGGAAPG